MGLAQRLTSAAYGDYTARKARERDAVRSIKNVLLVSYHFPPDAEIGGIRPYQFASLLPELGINCSVLTVDPEFAERPEEGLEPGRIPERRVIRTGVRSSRYDKTVHLAS